jgi:putative Holliday junction resolvase
VRTGIRLACDVGKARIGIARSDPRGVLAVPLDAIKAGEDSHVRVRDLAVEYEVIEIIVGLPISMSGELGPAAEYTTAWVSLLAAISDIPIRLHDERLTTVQAQRGLHEAGRTTKSSRSIIDSASAVVLLQTCLDSERSTGVPVGTEVRRES